jgi:hypothetical protein
MIFVERYEDKKLQLIEGNDSILGLNSIIGSWIPFVMIRFEAAYVVP